MSQELDANVFWERSFRACERISQHGLKGLDVFVVNLGNHDATDPKEAASYERAKVLSLHLMDGYQFPSTTFGLSGSKIVFAASENKVKHLKKLQAQATATSKTVVDMEFLQRQIKEPKNQTPEQLVASQAAAKALLETTAKEFADAMKKASSKSAPRVGLLGFENDPFVMLMRKAFEANGSTIVTEDGVLRQAMGDLLSVKDSSALEKTRVASDRVGKLLDEFRRKTIPTLAQDEVRKPLSAYMTQLDAQLEDLDKGFEIGVKTNLQSGENFDVSSPLSVSPDPSQRLTLDTLLVSLACRNAGYHAYAARTYLIDPTPTQKAGYQAASLALIRACDSLRPGATMNSARRAALEEIRKSTNPVIAALEIDLAIGSGIGLTSFEEGYHPSDPQYLDGRNGNVVEAGMCFWVCLQLQWTENDKKYALRIGDTIYVTPVASPTILTESAKSDFKKIHFLIAQDDEDEAEDEDDRAVREAAAKLEEEEMAAGGGRRPRTRASTKTQAQKDADEEKKKRQIEMGMHQREWMLKKAEIFNKALEKDSKDEESPEDGAGAEEDAEDVEEGAASGDKPLAVNKKLVRAYKSPRDLPNEHLKRDRISTDSDNNCVFLPIGGVNVPFHVSTIKSVTRIEDILRFNFFVPVGTMPKDVMPEMRAALNAFPQLTYVKELSFRSRNTMALETQFKHVRDLQKRVKDKQKREIEEAGIVEQEELIPLQNRSKELPATLDGVTIIPSLGKATARVVGVLKTHVNGFRFVSHSDHKARVDIIFSNVRFFFFQKSQKELKVLIHFYLKSPIMVGNKRTMHVQFYTEVMEASSKMGTRHQFDPDEVEEEKKEREVRKRLDKAFFRFCEQSLELARQNNQSIGPENEIEMVDQRDLGFNGKPLKEMVFITPTTNTLVNLTERDFFVVDTQEIEHVHLERVSIGRSKQFDMVFILKSQLATDGSAEHIHVKKIEAIPMENLDTILQWIDLQRLTVTIGTASLSWEETLREVRHEIEDGTFWKRRSLEGERKDLGWTFLNPEADNLGLSSSSEDESGSGEDSSDDSDDSSSEDSDPSFKESSDDSSGEDEGDDDSDDEDDDDDSSMGSVVDEDEDDDEDGSFDEDEEDEEDDWEAKAEAEDREEARKRKLKYGDGDSDDEGRSKKRRKHE